MNRIQREIVRDFVSLHHDEIKEHLRSVGLINNNGTIPGNAEVQNKLEQWFFLSIGNYSLELDTRINGSVATVVDLEEQEVSYIPAVEYTGNVDVQIEISKYDSGSGNPVTFEFDANIWPHLLEEAVDVYVVPGEVLANADPSIHCDVLGDSRSESYRTLFIEDDFGAIADIAGLSVPDTGDPATYATPTPLQTLVSDSIDRLRGDLLDYVLQYGRDLIAYDENGVPTEESVANKNAWFEHNSCDEFSDYVAAHIKAFPDGELSLTNTNLKHDQSVASLKRA